MEDIRRLVGDMLEKGKLIVLGTVDEKGPWVCNVIYVHDNEFNIYWLSYEDKRHSIAMQKNPHIAALITFEQEKAQLQIEGNVERLEGDILELAIKQRKKRGNKPIPTKIGEVLSPGEYWYKLKPTKMELTDEPRFGFKKQKLLFT